MFSISVPRVHARAQTIRWMAEQFDEEDEVHELGTRGTWAIGPSAELDEDETTDAVFIGTVGGLLEELPDA